MDRYIVIRKAARESISFDPAPSAELSAAGGAPPVISIERLDAKQLHEVTQDPDADAAPEFPMSLITPLPLDQGDGAGDNWGLSAIKADHSEFSGEGTVVAVLDTGIDAQHAAFQSMELVRKDFTGTGDHDGHGHGTHCAGTIFGRDVDGRRIGTARGVKRALIGKVFNDSGKGPSTGVFEALNWAGNFENGTVDIISMSLGFDFPGYMERLLAAGWPRTAAFSRALTDYRMNLRVFDSIMETIEARRAQDEGVVVVAAAGNENLGLPNPQHRVSVSLPAAAKNVISVGAINRGEGGFTIAPFSNSYPLVCAPGVAILSARTGGGLVAMKGTSMACPHVAGVAALWWQKLRSQSPSKRTSAMMVQARLLASLRADVFALGVQEFDRGEGLVTSP
jgi:subtilisin family serine protease